MSEEITLEEEGGVTQVSLMNIRKLMKVHNIPIIVIHYANSLKDLFDQHTKIIFEDGFEYEANGFSCGYAGEGARGLETLCKGIMGNGKINIKTVASWDYNIHLITKNFDCDI